MRLDVAPAHGERLAVRNRYFDGLGAKRPHRHLVVGEERRRQQDLVPRVDQRCRRQREGVVRPGGDDHIVRGCRDVEVGGQPLGERRPQTGKARIGRIQIRGAEVERITSGRDGRRRRWEERKRLAERDDVVPLSSQLCGPQVQRVERGQLDLLNTRADAGNHAPMLMRPT
jgi:hypothetical protein